MWFIVITQINKRLLLKSRGTLLWLSRVCFDRTSNRIERSIVPFKMFVVCALESKFIAAEIRAKSSLSGRMLECFSHRIQHIYYSFCHWNVVLIWKKPRNHLNIIQKSHAPHQNKSLCNVCQITDLQSLDICTLVWVNFHWFETRRNFRRSFISINILISKAYFALWSSWEHLVWNCSLIWWNVWWSRIVKMAKWWKTLSGSMVSMNSD